MNYNCDRCTKPLDKPRRCRGNKNGENLCTRCKYLKVKAYRLKLKIKLCQK